MWTSKRARCRRPARRRQAGVAAVEFALLSLMIFTLLFGIIEVARALYMWNTLQEVTRRAARGAAMIYPTDTAALNTVRQNAIFRADAGLLALGAPVTDAHIRIDYLALSRDSADNLTAVPLNGTLPNCAARNRVNCMSDPFGANCIRLVRVRLCQPEGVGCEPIPYQPLLPFTLQGFNLPSALSVVKAESLGYEPGSPICP
ncbi:pilus assembly protein [Oxalobacteraceae bacterium]|nr:pilus assembly protein [Oxalobacteraceae bacterium]